MINKHYKHIINHQTSLILHLIRGLAAFIVVICHTRGHFFVAYGNLNPTSKNVLNYILFAFTRMGHPAVIVFFVLSGYLVGGNLFSNYLLNKINFKKYFADRISRMWAVAIPALLIGGFFDFFTLSFRGLSVTHTNLNFTSFIGNIAFLQTICVPVFGINSPLWSLAYEFWYYIFGAFLVLVLKLPYKFSIKLCLFFVILFSFYLLSKDILQLFPIWLLGVFCRFNLFALKGKYSKNIAYLFLILFITNFCLASQFENLVSDYILSITFSLFLISLNTTLFKTPPALGKFYTIISSFSFSLYVIHYPLQFFIYEIAKAYFHIPIRLTDANTTNWFILLCNVIVIYSFAYLFFILAENNTNKFRIKIYSILNIK